MTEAYARTDLAMESCSAEEMVCAAWSRQRGIVRGVAFIACGLRPQRRRWYSESRSELISQWIAVRFTD